MSGIDYCVRLIALIDNLTYNRTNYPTILLRDKENRNIRLVCKTV